MSGLIDITGQRFGRLVVTERAPDHVSPNGRKRARWSCECDCGNVVSVDPHKLRIGWSRSCGCLQADVTSERNTTHGMRRTPEYKAWCKIKERCLNPNDKNYSYYGGAGRGICKEWADNFEAFYEHIGQKPETELTVDRIDNSKGYEPGNVRWATRATQARNRTDNHTLTHNGKTMCLTDWADEVGIGRQALSRRINALGWSVAEALTTPVGGRRG